MSVCVFALRRWSAVVLAYVHIRLISVDASVVAVLSQYEPLLLFLSLFTHMISLMARVPELSLARQHSRPDTYRSAHCMTFPCSYPL